MKSNDFKLDVLFVSEREIWPHDHPIQVQGYHLACACHELGLRVGYACMCPDPQSVLPAWLDSVTIPWPTASQENLQNLHQSWSGLFATTRLRLSRHHRFRVEFRSPTAQAFSSALFSRRRVRKPCRRARIKSQRPPPGSIPCRTARPSSGSG